MINQFDYMKLRPVIEPVFHDNIDSANAIIKAIQTYHDDEDYVPKVAKRYNILNLENTVIFQIDSQKLTINGYDGGYDVNLVTTRFDITEERPLIEYKVLINAYCHIPHRDDIRVKGYAFVAHGNPYDPIIAKEIESGVFEKWMPEVLGKLVWAAMYERFKMVRRIKDNLRELNGKPKQEPVTDLDPDSLMMEPELLWADTKETKNGKEKER